VTPRHELVNTLEFEAEAGRVLAADVLRRVAGSDRAPFDRLTFRPRLMVNCVDLDLTAEVAGVSLFAPIVVAPIADQRQFHADGELATVRGAAAANAAVVISARSTVPIESVAKEAATPLFVQIFSGDDAARSSSRAQAAVDAGCRAVVVTIGTIDGGRSPGRADWQAVEAARRAVKAPVIVKGVMTVEEATSAIASGAQALVVSNYGRPSASGRPAPLDAIAGIADAVGRTVPVLADGGFRRGTDIMKALALGARAVLVGRPVMWGLAAYGADGVQAVLELLQTELARVMGCCGTPNLAAITRAHVKVHGSVSPGTRTSG
jgi:4-hydroxymandelate oxidase